MNKTLGIIIAIIIVVIVGAGAYYFFKSPSYNPTPSNTQNNNQYSTPQDNQTTTPNQQNSQNLITIKDFAFSPATMTVKAGTTVTWTNQDSAAHSIKSDKFNSSNLSNGDTYQFTFKDKGTFDYICGIHTYMKGKIVVE